MKTNEQSLDKHHEPFAASRVASSKVAPSRVELVVHNAELSDAHFEEVM